MGFIIAGSVSQNNRGPNYVVPEIPSIQERVWAKICLFDYEGIREKRELQNRDGYRHISVAGFECLEVCYGCGPSSRRSIARCQSPPPLFIEKNSSQIDNEKRRSIQDPVSSLADSQ